MKISHEETVVAHGKRFAVYAVFVEYASWHKSPTGYYGWAREVGSKRRGLVTGACITAADARAAAKQHIVLGGVEKTIAQRLYEAAGFSDVAWEVLSTGERSPYERMASLLSEIRSSQ